MSPTATRRALVLQRLLEHGPIQILVNNAGRNADAPLAGMSRAQWSGVIDVILNGFFHVTQPLLLPMIRTRWGRIVNVASVAALAGNRGQANYAAAKAGLIGAGKALALEVASRGITVNSIAPGIIATPLTDGVFDAGRIKELVPMQRAGTPEDVAQLVGFLVSDSAAYISGTGVVGQRGDVLMRAAIVIPAFNEARTIRDIAPAFAATVRHGHRRRRWLDRRNRPARSKDCRSPAAA